MVYHVLNRGNGRMRIFATAMQTIGASWMILACGGEGLSPSLMAAQLASLAEQTVGNRPNRIEPRAR